MDNVLTVGTNFEDLESSLRTPRFELPPRTTKSRSHWVTIEVFSLHTRAYFLSRVADSRKSHSSQQGIILRPARQLASVSMKPGERENRSQSPDECQQGYAGRSTSVGFSHISRLEDL